jgi:ABC-type phosphate/phosphonate transport system substrate-binding protein
MPMLVLGSVLAVFAISEAAHPGQAKSIDVLKIGVAGNMTADGVDKKKDEGAQTTLRDFIKEETGLKNEIVKEKDWETLLTKMASGELHIGVFQGYEYAYAQAQDAKLKPLALAINVHRYPVISIVGKKDKVKDFAGLKGQTIAIPANGPRTSRMFVNHLSQASGQPAAKYFSKIINQENVEDALDDVVDGAVQAAAVDQAALDAYKRRKPGRFNQLQEIAKSNPLPPVIIAYYDDVLPAETLKKFSDGLLGAQTKDKGQTLLTLFRLTAFETVPEDFGKVLADTRKTYPQPGGKKMDK